MERSLLNGVRLRVFFAGLETQPWAWLQHAFRHRPSGGLLLIPRAASSQVTPAGDAGGYNFTVGATATGDFLEYGSRKMLGVAAIADLDTKRRIGIEGEAQWLMFHRKPTSTRRRI